MREGEKQIIQTETLSQIRVKIWGEGAEPLHKGFYSLNSPECYTQQSMVKRKPQCSTTLEATAKAKKKKLFSKLFPPASFCPRNPFIKNFPKISQVQELGLSVSVLYRNKAS